MPALAALNPKKSLARAVSHRPTSRRPSKHTALCCTWRELRVFSGGERMGLRHALRWRLAPWSRPCCIGMQGTRTNPVLTTVSHQHHAIVASSGPCQHPSRTVAENLRPPRPASPKPGHLCPQHSEDALSGRNGTHLPPMKLPPPTVAVRPMGPQRRFYSSSPNANLTRPPRIGIIESLRFPRFPGFSTLS